MPEGIVYSPDEQEMYVGKAIVIECFQGGELYYNLKKFGRYPPNVAKYFFMQVVSAIAHMHSRSFCHRDLKPWNIMLTKDLNTIKVIDFSYSTPLDPEEFDKFPQHLKGMLSGTAEFLAPEQLEPEIKDFTKLDVWALGVLLINMLT